MGLLHRLGFVGVAFVAAGLQVWSMTRDGAAPAVNSASPQ